MTFKPSEVSLITRPDPSLSDGNELTKIGYSNVFDALVDSTVDGGQFRLQVGIIGAPYLAP